MNVPSRPLLKTEFQNKELKEKNFLLFCNHCAKPACVRVCPTKATFKRKDGIVMQDMHRCIGCRFCMAACPFGARSFNWRDPRGKDDKGQPFIKPEKENKEYPTRMIGVVEKCTLCTERLGSWAKYRPASRCQTARLFSVILKTPIQRSERSSPQNTPSGGSRNSAHSPVFIM